MEEREYLLALNLVPDLGSDKIKKLISRFGSAKDIFLHNEKEISQIIGQSLKDWYDQKNEIIKDKLKRELKGIEKRGFSYLVLTDEEYPKNLKEIYNPPFVLYTKGKLLREDTFSVSIVGARKASNYGKEVAAKFSYDLARCGFTIVSGLALGIDAEAHYGSLKAGGRTIAVLGSGLDIIYPPAHCKLAEKISESGAVISEFPLGTIPHPFNFPKRNRIISGITMGTVVVEAGLKSGSLITAGLALEQGREVFAVPGKALSDNSKGVNQLIKDGAKLTDNLFDILEEFNINLESIQKKIEDKSVVLEKEEDKIISVLSYEPRHIDSFYREIGGSVQKALEILTKLELKGLVKQLPGKMFVKSM